MPNWTSQGLFQDITDRINGLPFMDKVAPGAHRRRHLGGKKYGLPFIIDLSVWMYNKNLFTAGRPRPGEAADDPEGVPADARAVAKLGGDVHGTFFGGNCGGCNVFTRWPIVWADGVTS